MNALMKSPRHLITRAAWSGLLLWPLNANILPCQANDSAFTGTSGTPKPLKGEHGSIAMESEKVSIVANDKSYDTVVDFIFRNDGKATSVQMGFPENSYGDIQIVSKSAFLKFASWVNGRKINAKRIVVSQGEGDVEAYWIKTVHFGARETKKIRVAYTSLLGGTTTWGSHNALTYSFTGENWKGLVKRSDLEVKITKPGLWIALPQFGNTLLTMAQDSTPERTIFRKTWRNWQAEGFFMFGLTKGVPFWLMDRDYIGEKNLKAAVTFRVGPVPEELPVGAEEPDAFTRDGVTYIQLSRLEWRLGYFASDLEKYRGTKVKTGLTWDNKTRVATLQAGAKTYHFSPGTPVDPGGAKPILLDGLYGQSLYVPLEPIAKKLGIDYVIRAADRNYSLSRGAWTGQ